MGEAIVAGGLFTLQVIHIKRLSMLIREANLDLVPKRLTFCANLSCVGFIFLVQCGDLALHFLVELFGQSKKQEEAHDTTFLILALGVQCCLIGAYFSFFLLVLRTTHGARTFTDLILHEEVPELVYLQTRKLLRDEQYKREEERRVAISHNRRTSSAEEGNGDEDERRYLICEQDVESDAKVGGANVSFHPHL